MFYHLTKFKLSLWKNWLIFKRNPISVIWAALQPSPWFAFLLLARVEDIDVREEETYDPVKIDSNGTGICRSPYFAYSPTSPLLDRIVRSLCNGSQVTSFTTADSLNSLIESDDDFLKVLSGALLFNDKLFGITTTQKLPPNLDLTLRLPSDKALGGIEKWETNKLYPDLLDQGPRSPLPHEGGEPYYSNRGFLYLQNYITLGLMEDDQNRNKTDVLVTINRFPFPAGIEDTFYKQEAKPFVAVMVFFSLWYNYCTMTNGIIIEKEKQLTELLKVMELPIWCSWASRLLQSFLTLFVAMIIVVLLTTLRILQEPIFRFSSPIVLFVFFMLFACCVISLSFLVSAFFSKATSSLCTVGLVYFVTFLPFLVLLDHIDQFSTSTGTALSLLSNSGMGVGIRVILNFESVQKGVQWNNLFDDMPPIDDIALGPIMLMLFLDAILYFLLALYVEVVFPTKYGVVQPWYFLCSRAYWSKKPANLEKADAPNKNSGENFETFTGNLPTGIRLINVSKTYGHTTVVDKFNLDMYEGHITVLLGHNGAGKTTTTSIITGMCSPSSGTAIVNGYDVRTNLRDARNSLGMCLQEDILLDELTVWDHLYFFNKLKGLKDTEAKQEIDNYLKISGLEDKKGTKSKKLSGGMKRKLCIGIAFCGRSKVVILDEPTSGVDPSARRAVWNFLQKQKQGRTILLTTHFMDEAEVLGDRIAIMSAGQLQCCGSSFFLKRRYESGYHLIMDVAPDCKSDKVTSLLKGYISNIQVRTTAASELSYRLPEKESKKFANMLIALEGKMTSLGVRSYGLSVAPLGEIFLKVGAQPQVENKNQNQKLGNSSVEHLKGCLLIRNQFIATFLKKTWSSLRIWYLFLFLFCFEIVMLILLIDNSATENSNPPLKISLDSYSKPTTLLSGDQNNYSQMYEKTLTGFELSKVENIETKILELTTASLSNVRTHYIVGASFSGKEATAWFNGDPFHSPPLALSLVLNALYKNRFGPQYSINFVNHPLPPSLEAKVIAGNTNFTKEDAVGVGGQLMFILPVFVCLFVIFCVQERVCKAKHLQIVSGLNTFVFWLTAFLFDLIIVLVLICTMLITLAALQFNHYKIGDGLDRVAVVLIVFGICVIPFIYLASFLFGKPSTAYILLIFLALATVFITIAIYTLSMRLATEDGKRSGALWIFLFVPFYSFDTVILDLEQGNSIREVCTKYGAVACSVYAICCDDPGYFSTTPPGIGGLLLGSIIMCILTFGIIFFIEYGLIWFLCPPNRKPKVDYESLETDVQDEYDKIKITATTVLNSIYVVVLRDLTKYYGNVRAANGLCLGVKPFECFGLLGVNGAGKTTTFQMMTGDIESSYGEIWVHGLFLKKKKREIYRMVGYCPQFDALLDNFTVKETFQMFCLIRGVPFNECDTVREEFTRKLDIPERLNRQRINTLSGGNKRKLSTAIALIGDPLVIYLDEPTTGMDPGAKRLVWSVLTDMRNSGKCIILSSHSMEECEALCTRLVIMDHGTFRCLGSIQRLKSKFAQGYSLTVKIKRSGTSALLNDQINAVEKFIQKNFADAQLKEKYEDLLVYELEKISMPLSRMFGILETNKSGLNIEDYSLGQCTLEQVIHFLTVVVNNDYAL